MRRTRDESGFTLIELLIAIMVMSVVITAVSASFIIGTQASSESATRLTVSQDAAFTSAFFNRDVQSSQTVSTSTTACGSANGLVLSLTWSNPSEKVDYLYSQNGGAGQLTRVSCGNTPGTVVVATQLSAQPPVPTCAPTCDQTAQTIALKLSELDASSFTMLASRRLA